MADFFQKLLASQASFMPHGHCYLWRPDLVWTMVLSDGLIGISYLLISATLYFLYRRVNLPFHMVLLAFGAFILACGLTHFMEIYTLWVPNYYLSAGVKVVTAFASMVTAFYLLKLYPHIFELSQASKEMVSTKASIQDFFLKRIATPPEVGRILSSSFYTQIFVTIALIVGCVFSVQYLSTSQAWVGHSDEILKEAHELQDMASSAQRDFRGYWLSGQKQLLDASLTYQDRFDKHHAKLMLLTQDNPTTTQLTQKINSDFETWRAFFEKHQNDKWNSGRDASTVKTFIETSEALLANVARDSEDLLKTEYELRAQRFSKTKKLSHLLILAIGSSAIFLGFIVLLVRRKSVFKISSSFGVALESEKSAREKAVQSLNQLDLVTNEAPVLLAQFDKDERLIFANASFSNWFGLDRATMIGKFFEEILGDERYPANKPYIDKALSGTRVTYERNNAVEDRVITHSITLVPHSDNAGNVQGLVVVANDVTKFKEFKDNEQIYRAVGEAIDYGIWICAPDGRNLYASESFLNLVGLTQEQCSNFGWAEILHPEDAAETIAAWKECVSKGTMWDRQHRFLGVDGKWHPILARGVPIRDENGNIVRWAGINLDISKQKKSQEAVEHARNMAERANRVKDTFLAILSHELRTPLTTILGWAQELQDTRDLPTQVLSGLSVIERSAKVQGQLIEDLLDISRIQSGKLALNLKIVDLVEVVKLAVQSCSAAAKSKNILIVTEIPEGKCLIKADATRMQQVIWNLLNNAIKFSAPSSKVVLQFVLPDAATGTRAKIQIKDNGKGISPEFLPRMFDRFSQEETSENRNFGGLGLGLSLVKHLLEMHGGTIRAESAGLGKGATFTFEIPSATSEESATTDQSTVTSKRSFHRHLEGVSLLIVDDDVDNLELFNHILRSSGAEIRLARSAAQARQMLTERKPDVIVSDISMPGEDGYSLIRSIRALESPSGDRMPTIALTAFASAEEIERIMSAGFDVHVSKPVNREKLILEIARLTSPKTRNSQS